MELQKEELSLRDKLKKIKEEYNELGKKEIKDYILNLFKKHKDSIRLITWIQYTPYYNDGDPCVFSIHNIGYFFTESKEKELRDKFNLTDDLLYEEHHGHEFSYSIKKELQNQINLEIEDLEKDIKELKNIIYENKEIIENLFGNNVEVKITLDNILISYYNPN